MGMRYKLQEKNQMEQKTTFRGLTIEQYVKKINECVYFDSFTKKMEFLQLTISPEYESFFRNCRNLIKKQVLEFIFID